MTRILKKIYPTAWELRIDRNHKAIVEGQTAFGSNELVWNISVSDTHIGAIPREGWDPLPLIEDIIRMVDAYEIGFAKAKQSMQRDFQKLLGIETWNR